MKSLVVFVALGSLAVSGCAVKRAFDGRPAADTRIEEAEIVPVLGAGEAPAEKRRIVRSVTLAPFAGLHAKSKAAIDDLLKEFDGRELLFELEGHTDSTGSEEVNQRVGFKRAELVRDYLAQKGVPNEHIAVVSYGETRPVFENDTPDRRAHNRRVVVNVIATR